MSTRRANCSKGRERDRAFFLETWDGDGEFTFDRVGRGTVFVNHMCLSVRPEITKMISRNLSRRLERLEARLMPASDPPVMVLVVRSVATGEVIRRISMPCAADSEFSQRLRERIEAGRRRVAEARERGELGPPESGPWFEARRRQLLEAMANAVRARSGRNTYRY